METRILSLNEPNNDLDPSVLDLLNLIGRFSPLLCMILVGTSFSIFKSSKVKKSENGIDLKFLLSFSGVALSNEKLVFVN